MVRENDHIRICNQSRSEEYCCNLFTCEATVMLVVCIMDKL